MPSHGTTSPSPHVAPPAARPRVESEPAEEPARRRGLAGGVTHAFRSLRHRNYRLYFFGQLVSLTGSWMQTTAFTWLAYELTHESTRAALASAAQVLPPSLLGARPPALAHRFRT